MIRTLRPQKIALVINEGKLAVPLDYPFRIRNSARVFDYVASQSVRTVELAKLGIVLHSLPKLRNLGRQYFPLKDVSYRSVVARGRRRLVPDMVILGGGEPHFINLQTKGMGALDSSDTRGVARVLVNTDHALETLLMLDYAGTLTLDELVEEIIPSDRIGEVLSALSRYDLVRVFVNRVSLTPHAKSLIERMKAKLQSGSQR